MKTAPPSYQEVLDVEKKMETFRIASKAEEDMPDSPDVAVSMRRWVRIHFLDVGTCKYISQRVGSLNLTTVLLSLHRAFFAQAISLNPLNPLDTLYGHSFLTAYRSACHVIQVTSEQFARRPQLLARVWMIWSLNFMSAVSF